MSPLKGKPAKRGKRVTVAEFKRLWESDMTLAQIGEALGGITAQSVCCRARMRGLPLRGRMGPSPQEIDEAALREMWAERVMITQIGPALNCTRRVVYKWAKRLGLPPRNRAGGITITEFQQIKLARAMAQSARIEQAAAINAEMVDVSPVTRRLVGAAFARGENAGTFAGAA